MKPLTKVYLVDDNQQKFFGEGPFRLLKEVERTGSLRAAAISMDMAYSKAMRLLKNAENSMGVVLTTRSTGGKKGGGSTLTPEGKDLLEKYEIFERECKEANSRIYLEVFGG